MRRVSCNFGVKRNKGKKEEEGHAENFRFFGTFSTARMANIDIWGFEPDYGTSVNSATSP
jgi:hypothetical protein